MATRRVRPLDMLLVLVPLLLGGAIGWIVGQRIAVGNPAECGEPALGVLSTAFLLGGTVVVLLVGTIIARVLLGPNVGRALFVVAIGILLSSCSAVVLASPADSCARTPASIDYGSLR